MRKLLIFATLLIALSGVTLANSVTYAGHSGPLSAQVTFSLSGSVLTVTLENIAAGDVLVPTDVLTGVLFNGPQLTPLSANLYGSTVWYGSIGNPGDGWGYGFGSWWLRPNAISATGMFGGLGHSNFSGANNPLQGLDYGILSQGDNSGTGNAGVTAHGPLVNYGTQFVFDVPNGFTLADVGNPRSGDGIRFFYGTSQSDPSFEGYIPGTPEPSTLLMLGSALVGVGTWIRRKLL